MNFKMRLLALAMFAPLAACATNVEQIAEVAAPEPAPAAEPVQQARAVPPPNPDTSLVGLYLAGNAAMRDGRADEAADYFARAAALVEEDGVPFLRERAFAAAVNAGEIERAASLAPKPGEGSQANQRLGKLVQSVDFLAKGDGASAHAILRTEDIGGGYRNAALLLRPWAAVLAGETDPVGQPRTGGGDRLTLAFSQANRALALEHMKRFDEAEAAFQGLASSGVTMGAFTLSHGAFLERQGKKAEAIALYDKMLAEQPDNRAVLMAKARASARRAAPPPAPTVQEAAAQAMMMAASGAMAQSQPESALVYVRMSLALDPDRPETLMMAAGFAEQRRDFEEARETYAKVPATAAEYLDARARIATTYRIEENLTKAAEVARETARLAPNDRDVQLDLADILRATGDYEGSAKVLTRLISDRRREPDWRIYFARAIALENANRWPEAEKDLIRALELNPNQPEIMNYLGYTWADRGEKLPEALELLQKAVRAQPNSGAIVDSLGWAYFRLGDIGKAVEHLERAVELSPSDPDINDHLGDAYAKIPGRRLEALYQWERVLTLRPDDKLKAKVEAKIAQEQRATSVANVDPMPPRP